MSERVRRRGPARRRGLLAALLLAAVTFSGCSLIGTIVETQEALTEAGYDVRDLDAEVVHGTGTIVSLRLRRTGQIFEAEAAGAARIVWTVTAFRVDMIVVAPDGELDLTPQIFPRVRLEAEFGPRPAGLDDETVGDLFDVGGVVRGVLAAAAGLLVVAVGGSLLVVVLMRRRPAPAPVRTPGWAPYADPRDPYRRPGPP